MERERAEHLLHLTSLGILAIATTLAFTKQQRDWIVYQRDEGHCQAPEPHQCNEAEGLEAHHIIPQRYGQRVGLTADDLDVSENAISLCKNFHHTIHPDMAEALRNYHAAKAEGRNTIEEVFKERDKTLDQRKPYWVTVYDRQLHVSAMKRTAKAKKKGKIFPLRKSQQ